MTKMVSEENQDGVEEQRVLKIPLHNLPVQNMIMTFVNVWFSWGPDGELPVLEKQQIWLEKKYVQL